MMWLESVGRGLGIEKKEQKRRVHECYNQTRKPPHTYLQGRHRHTMACVSAVTKDALSIYAIM